MLQNACSWLWGGGGEIISANGREIKFDQARAMDGLLAYLRLHRYMPPDIDRLVGDSQVVEQFVARRAGVVMGPCLWLKQILDALEQSPGLADKMGVALPPGPAFVGGSHFVMWSHTHHACEAVTLLQFLISKQAQLEYCYATGFLPVRPDVLAGHPYTTDARYQVVVEALRTGRTFPVVPKWGDIEERLGHSLVWLWNNFLTDPDQDLEGLARPYIEATARRLAVTLGLRR
jgi:multiple sugar transport system substrate-binding protein